jgi:hypothetical protein
VGWLERLIDRGTRAAADRARAIPQLREIERHARLAAPVITATELLARSRLDEETAAMRLRARLDDPDATRFALEGLRRTREDVFGDRAYRILYAAANDTAVPPVDPMMKQAFQAQERLAHLPLREAFGSLAERAPELRDIETQIVNSRAGDGDLHRYVHDRLDEVLTVPAAERDSILDRAVARVIAERYLFVLADRPKREGELDSPLIDDRDVPI